MKRNTTPARSFVELSLHRVAGLALATLVAVSVSFEAPATAAGKLVPIPIRLPKPMFEGTPQNLAVPNLQKPLGRPRDPFLAPAGVTNVAEGKPVTSSDMEPIIGEIDQITDDDAFTQNVRTLFNNDHDDSSGLGAGKDMSYVETAEGKLVDAKGHRARYVRLYSSGSNANELNHYVEVEVFGRPAR